MKTEIALLLIFLGNLQSSGGPPPPPSAEVHNLPFFVTVGKLKSFSWLIHFFLG